MILLQLQLFSLDELPSHNFSWTFYTVILHTRLCAEIALHPVSLHIVLLWVCYLVIGLAAPRITSPPVWMLHSQRSRAAVCLHRDSGDIPHLENKLAVCCEAWESCALGKWNGSWKKGVDPQLETLQCFLSFNLLCEALHILRKAVPQWGGVQQWETGIVTTL